jgi:enoyl-CoA hydratase
VVLLTAEGRAFCAGGDFAWLTQLAPSGELEQLRRAARQMIWDMLDVHLPIVCALNGSAAGLGASLALLSDTIFMAESATIADPHVVVGLVAGDGGTIAWPLAMGPARAKRHLLTGDPLTASEAERLGLVTDVVPDAEVFDRALEFCRRVANRPPLAVQYTKAAVNAWLKDMAAASFDLAGSLEIVTFESADHAEAMAAIAEKREPRFEGR